MPLTKKGKKIKAAMVETYGEEKGEEVFYKSQNKGTITGTHKARKKKYTPRRKHLSDHRDRGRKHLD